MEILNPFDLSGRVSMVTGGSSGIGKAICEAMARCGSDVVLSYFTNEAGARETECAIAKYGVRTLAVRADMANPQDIKSMFARVDDDFGKLDVLFNNAGMDFVIVKKVHELLLEDWNRAISVNLTSVFLCMKEAIKLMLRQKKGTIINISSILGLEACAPSVLDSPAYVTAKHGIVGLTRQAAMEYASEGIRINAIAPGWFASRLGMDRSRIMSEKEVRTFVQQFENTTKSLIPMGRIGDPIELIGIASYLASDASSYTTGAIFVVDGGWTSC